MEKFFISQNKNLYKANLHCHSTFSDGNLSPEELKMLYKSHGYQILAITDHEHLNFHSYLDDEDFLTITGAEYAIKEFKEQSTLTNLDMKVCHLNLYAKNQNNTKEVIYNRVYDHFSKGKRREDLKTEQDFERTYGHKGINEIIEKANQNGFFVSYNHPRWSLENYKDYSGYNGLWAVEVLNNASFIHGMYDYNINVYDDFLRDNKKIFLTAGDDNHNQKDDSFGAFTVVNAKDLKYETIVDALLNGDFYVSTSPMLYELKLKNNKVFVKCSDAEFIHYSTKGRRTKSVKRGTLPLTEAEFEIKKTDSYFRITIYDKNGVLNTQAYYL